MNAQTRISLADLGAARRRLATGLRVTPCIIAPALSELMGMRIWLKREDLHRTGSFKERGARNALLRLTPAERLRGVVAASAGNHALGLAFHGAELGVAVTVVVPDHAPEVKVRRCRALGAEVVLFGRSFDEAQRHAVSLAAARDAAVIHPFDDEDVIAGQGTMALEFLEQAHDIDTVVVPVGGGGLLAGIATAVKALRPDIRVVAVEPANAAGFLAAQICGYPAPAEVAATLADGLAVSQVGEITFGTAASLIDDLVTVSEDEIACAIALLARRAGAVVEGAGATPLAAVLSGRITAGSVLLPVTGRNIDTTTHEEILSREPMPRPTVQHAA